MSGKSPSDSNAIRLKWESHYSALQSNRSEGIVELLKAAAVLRNNPEHLPASGKALDFACGLGGNALFLATRGLQAEAWDISLSAVKAVIASAAGLDLEVDAVVRDVDKEPPQALSFDVIVISRFLDRNLCSAITDALKPGGLLYYQTFVAGYQGGPTNPAFLLGTNELPELFMTLECLSYREVVSENGACEAQYVGRKS